MKDEEEMCGPIHGDRVWEKSRSNSFPLFLNFRNLMYMYYFYHEKKIKQHSRLLVRRQFSTFSPIISILVDVVIDRSDHIGFICQCS